MWSGRIRDVYSMGNARDNFRQALYAVIEAYGTEILNDSRRTNALLMDYAPGQVRERKLIISALEEGIGNDLLKARDKNDSELQLCFKRCVRCLVDASWVTEEAAQFAVDVIAYALGISSTEIPQTKISSSPAAQNHITELAKGAFVPGGTDLLTLLGQHQVIGYKAFAADQMLKEVILPQTIKTIKPKAFLDCVHLKQITLPSTIEEIGMGVFAGCDALESISMERNPNYTVVGGMLIDKKNKALMRVTRSAAAKCVIPREVTTIHSRAFERSETRAIVLPRNLSELSQNAFAFCGKLESFEIDHHNETYAAIDGVLHSRDRKRLVRFPSGYQGVNYIIEETVTHIADSAFCGTANLETITFTSNLKSIGSRAFEYCRKLSSLVLPSSVEIIGERAFQYCDHLSSIMLPRSIQEIGDYAFCGCTAIQTISIPKGVKRIGHAAFKDCSSLRKIIIQDNIEFIGDGAFVGCADNIEIAIKNNSYVERYCSAHKITWSAL